MRVLDEGRGMSKKAATSALVSMWSCVGVSLGILYSAGRLTPWTWRCRGARRRVGTGMIPLYARKPHPAA